MSSFTFSSPTAAIGHHTVRLTPHLANRSFFTVAGVSMAPCAASSNRDTVAGCQPPRLPGVGMPVAAQPAGRLAD